MCKENIVILITIALVVSLLLSACVGSTDKPDGHTVDTPYAYPVLPETDEWQSLSMDERIALSYVDESVVKKMTTKAVLITTLNYPFIVNIFSYSKVNEGINVVKGYCPPLAELLQRDDALQVISSYIDETADVESVECHVADNLREYIKTLQAT